MSRGPRSLGHSLPEEEEGATLIRGYSVRRDLSSARARPRARPAARRLGRRPRAHLPRAARGGRRAGARACAGAERVAVWAESVAGDLRRRGRRAGRRASRSCPSTPSRARASSSTSSPTAGPTSCWARRRRAAGSDASPQLAARPGRAARSCPPRRSTEHPALDRLHVRHDRAAQGRRAAAPRVASNLDALADAWAWTGEDVARPRAAAVPRARPGRSGCSGRCASAAAATTSGRFEPRRRPRGARAGARRCSSACPTMYHRLGRGRSRRDPARRSTALGAARLLVSGSARAARAPSTRASSG